MFTGTGSFDGCVKSEQVGLLGEIVDNFDNLTDIIGAMTQDIDDFSRRLNGLVGAVEPIRGLFHGGDTGDDFFARAIGNVEKDFGGIGNALDRSNHLIDGCGCFRNAGGLYLRILHDVLNVYAHLVHGAGNFFNGGGSLHTDFGRFIGSTCYLIEPAETCEAPSRVERTISCNP